MPARFFLIILGLGFTFLTAQEQAPKNWFNLDPKQDGFPGISTESLYSRLRSMAGKKGETVVVAVIDSGVDYEHEDLKSVMFITFTPYSLALSILEEESLSFFTTRYVIFFEIEVKTLPP